MPREQLLVRELEIAALSASDTRNLIANELDRWTPFATGQVAFSHTVLHRDTVKGKNRISLALLHQTCANNALANAKKIGLSVSRMSYESQIGIAAPQLDFLATLAGNDGTTNSANARQFWWMVAASFVIFNLAFAVMRDYQDVASMRATVQSQAQPARLAARIKQRVIVEHQRRDALISSRTQTEPLKILDVLSRNMPEGVYVERLSWDGQTARLTGYKKGSIDIQSSLARVPEIKSVRNSSSEVAPQMELGQPFDISLTFRQQKII